MRKVIAAFNMTLDGNADHTAGMPDDETHQHYTDLLSAGGVLLYGRITYELMQSYWPTLVKNPSGNKAYDDFAAAIDKIPKVVFSRTLKETGWESARLAKRDLKDEVLDLRQQPVKDILFGSRSLIISLLNLNLIDELQLTVHPVIAGKGLQLFDDIKDRIILKLLKTKRFSGGAVTLFYEPVREGDSGQLTVDKGAVSKHSPQRRKAAKERKDFF
jgi:dihydrofolate reductase